MKAPNARSHPTVDSITVYLSAGHSKDARLYLDTDESYRLQSFVRGRRLEVTRPTFPNSKLGGFKTTDRFPYFRYE